MSETTTNRRWVWNGSYMEQIDEKGRLVRSLWPNGTPKSPRLDAYLNALEDCAEALANIEARTSREPDVSYVRAEVKEPLARLRELRGET